jgi:multidrug efflux pump subunit AcrA (membrane-fusion protein)
MMLPACAQRAEAQNNFVRMRDLVAEDTVSRATFDQAEALLKSAESQVEAAQAQVDLHENRLSFTRLVSTLAGVATSQGAAPGEGRRAPDRAAWIEPGTRVVQVLYNSPERKCEPDGCAEERPNYTE